LVAVDGSDTAKLALREAIKLAKEQRAELRLIHVIDESMIAWDESGAMGAAETVLDALRKAGQAIADKALAQVRKTSLKVQAVLAETFGERIASIIVEEAKRWPADLIVIGTHGRRGVDRLLLGSVAEGVVRLSAKPVLLIRGTQGKGRKKT
jgi:nucleotide-binding universal stress UspA family protein